MVNNVVDAAAALHERFGFLTGSDGAPCSQGCTVHRRQRIGEIEPPPAGPTLENAVNKSAVEDVARTGSIDDRNLKAGRVVEAAPFKEESSFRAQRHPHRGDSIGLVELLQAGVRRLLPGYLCGEFSGGNQMGEKREEVLDSGRDRVQVRHDGDAGLASPFGCNR